MNDQTVAALLAEVKRLADAVERLAGPAPAVNDWQAADCFVWAPARLHLQPVKRPNRVALGLIRGVDHVRDILHENTLRFAEGFAANNVLLWGARGMGKSSLVKAVHADIIKTNGIALKLVEVHREDISTLPALLEIIKDAPHRIVVFRHKNANHVLPRPCFSHFHWGMNTNPLHGLGVARVLMRQAIKILHRQWSIRYGRRRADG